MTHRDTVITGGIARNSHLLLSTDWQWCTPDVFDNKWSKLFNISQDRIAAADGRLNRIRQVVPMCPPMWAHWRQLANTKSTTQTADRSFQPFLHSWQHKVPILYKNWNCHFPWGIWNPIYTRNYCLGPSNILRPQSKRHLERFSSLCTGTDYRRVSLDFTMGRHFSPQNCPFPWGYLNHHLILGPPESSTQTASRSVQPFLQGSVAHCVTDRQTDRPTDKPRYSVGNN